MEIVDWGSFRRKDIFWNFDWESDNLIKHIYVEGCTLGPGGFLFADGPKDVFSEDSTLRAGEGGAFILGYWEPTDLQTSEELATMHSAVVYVKG